MDTNENLIEKGDFEQDDRVNDEIRKILSKTRTVREKAKADASFEDSPQRPTLRLLLGGRKSQ